MVDSLDTVVTSLDSILLHWGALWEFKMPESGPFSCTQRMSLGDGRREGSPRGGKVAV